MTARNLCAVLVVLSSLLFVSCGSDDPGEPGGGGGPRTLTISLPTTTAAPGADVPVAGIPASVDLDGAHMIARAAGTAKADTLAAGEWTVLIGRGEDGTPFFASPLVPHAPVAGDVIELRLAGTDVTSNIVTFVVAPLPAATTTVADMVTNLQGLLDAWLDVHGVTREELRDMDPASMPQYLYPLWIAHDILDSPDNPNSLRATVDGPVPFFDDEALDLDVTDRLVSISGIVDFLDAEIASIDSLPRPEAPATAPRPRGAHAPADAPAKSGCNIPAGDYGIDTASELDIAMEQGVGGFERLDGDRGETLSKLSKLATAAGVVPKLKPGATVASAGLYVYKLINEAAGKLLPTAFDYEATRIVVAGDDFEYNEDDEGGYWTELHVRATSLGWALDQDIMRAILKIGKMSAFGGIPLPVDIEEFAANLIKYAISEFTKAFIDVATQGDDFLEVCPGEWNVSDGMDSSVFSESEIASGTSFEMSSQTFFETRGPGVSELRVHTHPDRFGGVPPAFATESIEVVPIEVEVTPTPVTMEDSEVQTFDAVVRNASDDRVAWTVPSPLQEIERTNFGRTIVVQAPPPGTNWNSVVLKARSQANTGSREGKVDSDPRDGFAAIDHADSVVVEIEPTYACIEAGKDTLLTATVYGTDEGVTLNWSLDGWGSISQSGLYTAPHAGSTTDHITVTVEEYPYATATATVNVGACNCNYSILTYGLNIAGGDVAYLFTNLPEGNHNYAFFYELEEYGAPEGVAFTIAIGPTDDGPAPLPGETGFYPISVSYVDEFGQAWVTNDSTATVELFIEEHTANHMKGQFTGSLAEGGGYDYSVPVSGSFRAGRWDGGQWPCE